MLDIVLESIGALILGLILGYLWWFGRKNSLLQQPGWFYVVAGFALMLFGGIVDITDNFESLNKYIVIGDTEAEAMLEKVVGFLLGSSLLAFGLWKWLPAVFHQTSGPSGAPLSSGQAGKRHRKWTLTILFSLTAIVAIPLAAIILNRVIFDMAESNLIRLTESHTVREGRHMRSMAMGMLTPSQGQPSMQGMAMPGEIELNSSEGAASPAGPTTMEDLASPQGLPSTYRMLVSGLNIARISLLDLNGRTVWSSDPNSNGVLYPDLEPLQAAVTQGSASEFVRDSDLMDLDGIPRRIDVIKMFLPISDADTGEIVGVILADRGHQRRRSHSDR